jgi:hypothetical protein
MPVSESFQPPFGSREERIAHNEDWSRNLNEQRAEWMVGRDPMAGFRCECWQQDCTERIPLSGAEWAIVRAEPNRFAVAPNHVAANVEAVVRTYPVFWLVEKLGEAGRVAEELAGS